jgi:uncharacterized protein YoxC
MNTIRETSDRMELTGSKFSIPTIMLIFVLSTCGTVAGVVWYAAVSITELRLRVESAEKENADLREKTRELREDLKNEITYRTNTRERLIGVEGRVTVIETSGWRPTRR